MATISGIWKFNDILTQWPEDASVTVQTIQFRSMNNSYDGMGYSHASSDNFYYRKGSVGSFVYVWDDNAWLYNDAKIVNFFSEPQSVSDEFYAWFTANAVEQQSVAATLKGKWVFNDILVNNTSNNDREDIQQDISFSSNNRNFESVYIEFGNYENGLASLSYRLYNGTGYNVMYVEGYGWSFFGQADRTPYKIIDFGETEQTVNDDFYAWFKANSIGLDEPTTDTKPVYLRKNGAWVKQDAYERQNSEWVQVSYAD